MVSGFLQDQAAIVTGAARGIGRATAPRLAHEGANLLIADLDLTGGEAVAAAIRELGRNALVVVSYNCSKAAVVALTRTFGVSLARHGIRVNAVCPGLVDTEMWAFFDRLSTRERGLVTGGFVTW